jgi:hypothetical protein
MYEMDEGDLGRPSKILIVEAETGTSRPNSLRMRLLMMICDRKVTPNVEVIDFALYWFSTSGLNFRCWIVNGGLLLIQVADNSTGTNYTEHGVRLNVLLKKYRAIVSDVGNRSGATRKSIKGAFYALKASGISPISHNTNPEYYLTSVKRNKKRKHLQIFW